MIRGNSILEKREKNIEWKMRGNNNIINIFHTDLCWILRIFLSFSISSNKIKLKLNIIIFYISLNWKQNSYIKELTKGTSDHRTQSVLLWH